MSATFRLSGLLAVGAALLWSCGGSGGSAPPAPTYAVSGTISGAGSVTVSLSGAASASATSDAAGGFSFAGLSNGTYTLTPTKAGYLFTPATRSVTVAGSDVAGQAFTATPVFAISGTVSGTTGVAVALTGNRAATTTTDGAGAYAFPGLPAGAYTVTPSKGGFIFAPPTRAVSVTGADVTGQDFAATPIAVGSRTITGAIHGTIVQGVSVTLRSEPGGAALATVRSDVLGNYILGSLPDGAYSLTPSHLDSTSTFHAFDPLRRLVTLSGADATGQDFTGAPLPAYEDFSSGAIGAPRWDSGQHTARLSGGMALLAAAIDAPDASASYGSSLEVAPGAVSGRITSLQAVVQLVGAGTSLSGDAVGRAGIDFLFQPLADRVASPDNRTNAVFVRLALQRSASGLVAVRQALECTNPDCTTTQGVGTVVSGGSAWPGAGLGSVAADTPYTLSIAFDTTQTRFTFGLQGGSHTTAVTTTLDLSSVASQLTQEHFYQARLLAHVRGGVQGGAGSGGSVAALFDDVAIGVGGASAAPFDDFGSGTLFDPARWDAGGDAVLLSGGALDLELWQQGSPTASGLTLRRGQTPAPSILQARAELLAHELTGTGQAGVRLAAAVYNDGSNGLGTAPDVNGPSSQVGDVIAQLSMSAADVSYAVIRCNVAVCTGPQATGNGIDFVVPRTSLLTGTLGQSHTLLLRWDAATHLLLFEVDDLPAAVVDPTADATGVPVMGAPSRELWQLANHSGAAGPGLDFGPGSSAHVHSRILEVRKR